MFLEIQSFFFQLTVYYNVSRWAPKKNVDALTKQTRPASLVPQTQLLYTHLSNVTKMWTHAGSQNDNVISLLEVGGNNNLREEAQE